MARSTTERSDRLLGRIPRASRAPPTSIDWRRPILPWALLVFLQACRVLFHSTPRRSFVERVSSRTANRRGPLSVGRHPLMGFARDCCRDACSGKIHIVPGAQGVPGTQDRCESICEATSLPSLALQRIEAFCAWSIRAIRSSRFGIRGHASVSDRLPV